MKKQNKTLFKIIAILIILGIVGVSLTLGIDLYVKEKTKSKILSVDDIVEDSPYEAILVLGAGLVGDKPSPMLQERLDKGIELYERGVAPIIIMSGDHATIDHDEVNVMKLYAIDKGVPSDDIFMDHAGISTYDSVYRAKEVFDIDRIAIVTQGYHLYRAIYIADSLGLDASGVDAKVKTYRGQLKREVREILARNKDFIKCFFRPSSLYRSEAVSVSSSGNKTNDKPYISIKSLDGTIEHFISEKTMVERIENFLFLDWTTEKCDGIPEYLLEFKDGRTYNLEIYDNEVHITDSEKEIVLNGEQSLLIKNILES